MNWNKLFLRWISVFGMVMVFAVSGWGVCIDDAVNSYNQNGTVFMNAKSYVINNPDNQLTAKYVVDSAGTPWNSCQTQGQQCVASGTPFTFTPFMSVPNLPALTVDQSFNNPSGDQDYTSNQTVDDVKKFGTLKVREGATVTMNVNSDTSLFQIKTLLLGDINSNLTVNKASAYDVKIEDAGSSSGGVKSRTSLTLNNASSLTTRGFKQGDHSTVNLPDVTTINAGNWKLVGNGATLTIGGTDGDYRFKDGIDGATGNTSLNVASAASFYSQGLKIENLDIHGDTIYINGDLIITEKGRVTINPNKQARVTMKVNATVEFKHDSKVYLAAGDYYFQNLKIGSNVQIIPIGSGAVRIFAYSSFSDASSEEGMQMNENGDPSKLLLYSKNTIQFAAKTTVSGLVISEGDVTSYADMINGAIIAGGNVTLKDKAKVTYDARVKGIDSGSSQTECVSSIIGFEQEIYQTSNTSLADMVDDFNLEDYNNGTKYIKTKIADKLEPLTAVHLNESQNAEVFTSVNSALYFKVIPYISDETCTQRTPILDANGSPLVINIANGNASATAYGRMPNAAIAVARFSLSALDMSKLYEASKDTCLLNSSATGNLQGIGQCVNSEQKYKAIFGDTAWDRCYNNNGEPCKSNNHGVGTGIYANDYGCLMCTLDSNISCSSDNFAIRPFAFKTFGQNQYKRAGEDFNLTVKALNETDYNATGTVQSVNGLSDYNESTSVLDIKSQTYIPSLADIAQMRSDTGKTDVATCPESGVFTVTDANFTNGELNVSMKYSETGIFDVNISEIPGHEFARVDADDTNDSERYIQPAISIYDENNISAKNILLFAPYSFDTHATYNTTNDMDWLYMNDINHSNTTFTKPDMAAYVSYTITAKNKDGDTVKNYTSTCFPDVDEVNAPRVNGLKLNTTFDLFLDLNLNSSADANISLYSEDNSSNAIYTLTKNKSFVAGLNSVRELIFPPQFNSGVGKAKVYFNIDRNSSVPLNPITIQVVDANTSTSWMTNPGSPKDFNGTVLDSNKTFVYGRLIPRDVRVFGNVDFTANAWCEVFNAPKIGGTLLPPSKNTPNWFTNTLHNDQNYGDGNVTRLQSPAGLISGNIVGDNVDGIKTYNFGAIGATNIPYNGKAHINIDPWLWYGVDALPYLAPSDTNLNCLTHPCFNITVVPSIGRAGSSTTDQLKTDKLNKSTTVPTGITYDYSPTLQ